MQFEIDDIVYDSAKNKMGVVIGTSWLWLAGVIIMWNELEGAFYPERIVPKRFIKIGEL